jgi:hypothetical protein
LEGQPTKRARPFPRRASTVLTRNQAPKEGGVPPKGCLHIRKHSLLHLSLPCGNSRPTFVSAIFTLCGERSSIACSRVSPGSSRVVARYSTSVKVCEDPPPAKRSRVLQVRYVCLEPFPQWSDSRLFRRFVYSVLPEQGSRCERKPPWNQGGIHFSVNIGYAGQHSMVSLVLPRAYTAFFADEAMKGKFQNFLAYFRLPLHSLDASLPSVA